MRTVVFFFVALCAVSALSLVEDKKSSKPAATMSPGQMFTPATQKSKTTTVKPASTTTTTTTTAQPKPPTNTTTAQPKPTTTTTKPKPPTNTTTAKPIPTNTTTAKPIPTNTTTAKPIPTNTTTAQPKPTTTTTAKPKPPTTTAKPTPPPSPKPTPSANLTVGKYNLTTDKKVICLMAQMALQIRLAKPKDNGTFIIQPSMTTANGGCQQTKANLTLVFKEGFITLMFNKSTADNAVYVDALSFVLNYPLSKGGNAEYKASNKSLHLFTAKVGHSYSCRSESLYMGNGLYLDIQQDRMQAFNLTKSNEFGVSDPCAADKPDYRVAIAVGVTLLVLICIVVVAYLLGRRRRTDGYQSL
ncbi:macrosialin [Pempheris klunzingeri]|uniref:macrosialin n=1 Tax=Pempheris klunzingeri TaxID=3127111 RepID=UPI00397F8CCE